MLFIFYFFTSPSMLFMSMVW